ncbi:hypothetical protein Plhal703r1_c04g0021461 [Plasmopara halstedii]
MSHSDVIFSVIMQRLSKILTIFNRLATISYCYGIILRTMAKLEEHIQYMAHQSIGRALVPSDEQTGNKRAGLNKLLFSHFA